LIYWVENQSNEIDRKGFPVIPTRDVSNTILVLSSSLRAWNAYVA